MPRLSPLSPSFLQNALPLQNLKTEGGVDFFWCFSIGGHQLSRSSYCATQLKKDQRRKDGLRFLSKLFWTSRTPSNLFQFVKNYQQCFDVMTKIALLKGSHTKKNVLRLGEREGHTDPASSEFCRGWAKVIAGLSLIFSKFLFSAEECLWSLIHSHLETTEGWNTTKCTLNKWPSLKVHHWASKILILKGTLHQKIFYRLNLIFWIVMGCGIARYYPKYEI